MQKFNSDDLLATLLSKTTRALSTRLHSLFINAGFDVTPEQWMIMLLLWDEDGRNPYQIAEIIGKDRAGVTRLIDGLEKRNLAFRSVDKTNNRQKKVYLTPLGKALQADLVSLSVANMERAQYGLADANIDICKDVLKTMYRNLTQ